MIDIKRKEDCVGCNACVQRCPKHCIAMYSDEQGFLYPKVNLNECIDCHLCEKVCPVINISERRLPEKTFAAWNRNDNIRAKSSSGGVFFALGKRIIEDGGVVFGAKFNDKWEVIHSSTDNVGGLSAFMGSKYVQSHIGNTYKEAEGFLKCGRKVLFSGTPCQITGLRRYLRKDYGSQLLTIDVVCHGVPSPGIWKAYLNTVKQSPNTEKISELQSNSSSLHNPIVIENISFRDKRLGWENYGIAILYASLKDGSNIESRPLNNNKLVKTEELFERYADNPFMQGFLKDLFLRPSCYKCPTKCGRSHSDITIADFWGIRKYHPEIYSTKGVSLLLVNSQFGAEFIDTIDIEHHIVSYSEAIDGNPAIEKSATKPKIADSFWNEYRKEGFFAVTSILNKMKPTFFQKIKYRLKTVIIRLFLN